MNMQAHAKEILRLYMKEHPRVRPGEMETDLCGVSSSQAFQRALSLGGAAFNESVFGPAFCEMYDDGEIIATKDDGGWLYELPSAAEKDET